MLRTTNNAQEPFIYGSLGGNDVPLVPVKPVAATGPQADPQASIRKDYELSLQLGTREGWEAFLRTYPAGFYADLAKGQLNKIGAEETRTAAAEKARLTEQERARLATEGARQAEQARAAAAAKNAEEARIAAEKARQIEQEKAAAAERSRISQQEKVRLAAEKAAAVARHLSRVDAEVVGRAGRAGGFGCAVLRPPGFGASTTCTMWSSAPNASANVAAQRTARSAVSDRSVPTMTRSMGPEICGSAALMDASWPFGGLRAKEVAPSSLRRRPEPAAGCLHPRDEPRW